MKKIIQFTVASMMLAMFVLSGCKKGDTGPKGETGSQGPQGPVVDMRSGGHITGTITGTRRDGVPFSEPFSYTYYFPGNDGSGTLDSLTSGGFRYNFQRQEADIFGNNNCYLTITSTSKAATTGTLNINLQFQKILSTTQLFNFTGYTSTATATGLSYNSSTGSFSGNFNISLTGFENNTGNPVSIIGNFQANVVQYVYKRQENAMIKVD